MRPFSLLLCSIWQKILKKLDHFSFFVLILTHSEKAISYHLLSEETSIVSKKKPRLFTVVKDTNGYAPLLGRRVGLLFDPFSAEVVIALCGVVAQYLRDEKMAGALL